ncbi:ribonuclease H-like domain-containing protein [Tanacetum coccineum]
MILRVTTAQLQLLEGLMLSEMRLKTYQRRDKGDYDLWSIRMEQYLTHTDYALWEVIMNGDAPAAVASASTGAEGPIPPKTAKQKLARKNELKAKKYSEWQCLKRFIKKTGRKMDLNDKEIVGFDRIKVECYNFHRRGHFARECRAPRNQGNRNRDAPRRNALVDTSTTNALVVQNRINGLESLEARIVVHEKNEAVYEEDMAFLNAKDKTGLGYDSQINESEVVYSMFNSRESDMDNSLVIDRFKTGEGFHAVPPPYTRNYMSSRPDLSFAGLDDYPKTVRHNAPIFEEWDTDSDNDSVFRPKSDQTKPKFTGQREIRPVWNNA